MVTNKSVHEYLCEVSQIDPIKIIDAGCGSGKTSMAIQMMNDEEYEDNKFIYITPYLGEVDRIKDEVKNRTFIAPQTNEDFSTKSEHLYHLVKAGMDIVTTHSLFQNITKETLEALWDKEYILILDEVMDVVEPLQLSKGDVQMLINAKAISVNDKGFVAWNDGAGYDDTRKFKQVKALAKAGSLTIYNNTALIWNFPCNVFNYFRESYILTYLFMGQLQRMYFDFYNIQYEFNGVKGNRKDGYELVDYKDGNRMDKYELIKRINIYEGKYNFEKESLSLNLTNYSGQGSGKNKMNREQRLQFQNDISKRVYNVLRYSFDAKANDTIVIMFSDTIDKDKFNVGRNYRLYTNSMLKKKKLREGSTNCLIPCNCRATNEYQDRHNVAYIIRRNINPLLKQFFREKGVSLTRKDEDIYSLSEMIQTIWRSAIRKNNPEPINLYIPDYSMRMLFNKYLQSDYFEDMLGYEEIE